MRSAQAILVLLATASAACASSIGDEVRDAARQGRGAMCGLDMKPATTDVYYPCIDFGPYRAVVEYGRVNVYVTGGGDPFPVFTSDEQGDRYLVRGPWEADMRSRWRTGGAAEAAGVGDRRAAAEQAVMERIEAERPRPAPVPSIATPAAATAPAPASISESSMVAPAIPTERIEFDPYSPGRSIATMDDVLRAITESEAAE